MARADVSVLVLEGGPKIDTRTDFNTHGLPFDFPGHQIPIMRPGKAGFDSPRSCGVGGKTLLWNAVALRFSERNLRGEGHDEAGTAWPLSYEDLSHYYSKVEREIGVCGNCDGLSDLPDGVFLPPAPLKNSDQIVKRGAERLGVKLIHTRKATLTKFTNSRAACHFCGNCMAGCDVVAKYNSADVHLYPAASETGKLEIRTNSIVYELAVEEHSPRVEEVKFFDRQTGERGAVRGRVVVVGCSCEQSIALLLMSKSAQFPRGLANNSGQVGQHFVPHIACAVDGFLKELIGAPTVNDEGFLDHSYIPSFMHDKPRDYPRSFGIQVGAHNRRFVPWAIQIKGIGAEYKKAVLARYPAYVTALGFTDITPNPQSYIDINVDVKDQYGLPIPQVNWKPTEADQKRWRDMQKWCLAILNESGAEVLNTTSSPLIGHHLGGCRMGQSARTSVVDRDCRTHEVSNLYIVDGSVFPASSEKHPTLTIMAVAARTADRITAALAKGAA